MYARHDILLRLRDERDAKRLREAMESLLKEAERDEIITPFLKGEVWNLILLPMFEEDMRLFQSEAWDCKEEDFGKLRAQALRSKALRDYFLEHAGKRDSYLEKAKHISGLLEGAEKEGRIGKTEEGK